MTAFRGVSFWYPGAPPSQPALADIHFTLHPAEFVLLCGPSGSGKSTLLRLCLGLVPQFSGGQLAGRITVLGRDPTIVPPREMAAAGVGLLFQNPLEGFVAERVEEEIAFGPEHLGLPAAEIESRIAGGLAAVGLAGFARRRLRDLSAGQQQRVALAAALALRPRVLLLDEPTAHLDEAAARPALQLVARLPRHAGTTVVLSEHRLGLAAPLVQRVLVLNGGRLIADGPPRVVLADPALPGMGVPLPRATQVAVRLGLRGSLPLTPEELAGTLQQQRRRTSVRSIVPPASPAPAARFAPTTQPSRAPETAGAEGPARLMFDGVFFSYPQTAPQTAPQSSLSTPPAVDGISFTLRAHEVAALVGPSGAGKSTLARLALGLLKPSQGRVELCGLSTHRVSFGALARVGGLVLQNPLHQLLAGRVDDELLLGLRDLDPDEARTRVEGMLEAFDLSALRARHPLALSEGQRRRVALAAVLVRLPEVVIMDEPTLGQDERGRASLVQITRRLAATGTAVLAISHDPEFVNDACDRVLLLQSGRLLTDMPMHVAHDAPERLAAAGIRLADVPATALHLARAGWPIRARHLPELLAALS